MLNVFMFVFVFANIRLNNHILFILAELRYAKIYSYLYWSNIYKIQNKFVFYNKKINPNIYGFFLFAKKVNTSTFVFVFGPENFSHTEILQIIELQNPKKTSYGIVNK